MGYIDRAINAFKTARNDSRTFGPAFLAWRFKKPNTQGIVSVQSRFGTLHFRPKNTDLKVLRQLFQHRDYDVEIRYNITPLSQKYKAILASGRTPLIIDAGANIGASSIWFSIHFSQAQIAAVEPDPENAELARLNTATRNQVKVFEAAIGSTPGNVSLLSDSQSGWAVRTKRSDNGIPVLTVSALVKEFPQCDLFIIKIDIEGFEADLFSSNVDWIQNAFAIFIELHDWMLPGLGSSQSFQRAIFGSGREIFVVGESLVFIKPAQ